MKNKVLILTSLQNHVWTSMQEIVPLIEDQWKSLDERFSVTVVNCDSVNLKDLAKEALSASLIVHSVFNASVAKCALFIRESLSIDTSWVIYLHGQATLGMWPYEQWGMLKLFKSTDLFIGTCDGDQEALNLILPEAPFYKSTFSFTPLEKGKKLNINHAEHSFLYIGRMTSQKQLHQLIWAYSMAKTKSDLHFFGSEDNLGSPNLGIEEKNYMKFLKELVASLGLEKQVHFHGFAKREDIHASLSEWRHTLVFPSLHSDENFGMSVMRGLCDGSTAICSDWGGFKEHLEAFPKSSTKVSVLKGKQGPFICMNELVHALDNSQKLNPESSCPNKYINENEIKNLNKIAYNLVSSTSEGTPLKPTSLLQQLIEQKKTIGDQKGQQIFLSYSDPLAHKFFKAYGMKDRETDYKGELKIAPWVSKKDDGFVSREPHKGTLNFKTEEELVENGLAVLL